jgi:hypothetical protein
MGPPPNCFLCIFASVIAREKQRKQLGSGAIADGETDAKNASVDGPFERSSVFPFHSIPFHFIAVVSNGESIVDKYCGAVEDPRFDYVEGCDVISIPYETEWCYCKTGARFTNT